MTDHKVIVSNDKWSAITCVDKAYLFGTISLGELLTDEAKAALDEVLTACENDPAENPTDSSMNPPNLDDTTV